MDAYGGARPEPERSSADAQAQNQEPKIRQARRPARKNTGWVTPGLQTYPLRAALLSLELVPGFLTLARGYSL